MGVISVASGNSCWRGLDYYKNNKVKKLIKINEMNIKVLLRVIVNMKYI